MAKKTRKTTVGDVLSEVLDFTAGEDRLLDAALVEVDCIGTAAHVKMLSRMPVKPPLLTSAECKKVIVELRKIIKIAKDGKFKISLQDQDVHLAVERTLTKSLGDLGKKVHTGRSRNDQVALDMRLYLKIQLLSMLEDASALIDVLLTMASRHERVPMVGRTHMQPAMPSSIGLWASAHAESLLDDVALLLQSYELNDRCPLGSAAGYGVPLPIDRQYVSDVLAFTAPCHNVLYASHTRGKLESIVVDSLSQVVLTLSRLAEDLILYSMPEFGYFTLPSAFCTGSSIMPQKNNPDVLELVRAKASRVMGCSVALRDLVKRLPSGYQRDLQEAKGPTMDALQTTRASLRVLAPLIGNLGVNESALTEAFTPEVFATHHALEHVAKGLPFRDAYRIVKKNLGKLDAMDPHDAVDQVHHLGGAGGLDLVALKKRSQATLRLVNEERKSFNGAISKLLGVRYEAASR